jgi:hypothetical protein
MLLGHKKSFIFIRYATNIAQLTYDSLSKFIQAVVNSIWEVPGTKLGQARIPTS